MFMGGREGRLPVVIHKTLLVAPDTPTSRFNHGVNTCVLYLCAREQLCGVGVIEVNQAAFTVPADEYMNRSLTCSAS